jgi:mannose-6-phosphate isomerase
MNKALYPLMFDLDLHELVWGGNRLRPLKGLPFNEEDKIGESWEVSAVPGKESVVSNGSLKGLTLTDVIERYQDLLLGKSVLAKFEGKFPLLVKFIDASKDLSIQVHPDDQLARERHGCYGKTEMWYVMDVEPEGRLFCGFREPINKEEYLQRIENDTICEVLQEYAVNKGDVFFIPAGRIHAICAGTLVAEVQQSSDVTYRIYDYGRMGLDGKPRQLHTELAVDALDMTVSASVHSLYDRRLNWPVCVTECPYFTVKLLELNRNFHRKLFKYDSFVVYMCLYGECTIEVLSTQGYEKGVEPETKQVTLTQGNSCLIPASVADVMLMPNDDLGIAKLLEVYIDNKNF